MIFNTYARTTDFEKDFKILINTYNQMGYGDLNCDALWKWSAILYAFEHIGDIKKKDFVAIDVGGGFSPLHFLLSNSGRVINVDNAFDQNWFPVKDDHTYVNAGPFKYNKENIQYKEMNFSEYIKQVPDNSIDFVYDSCSIIHFHPRNKTIHLNYGCHLAGKEIYRVLKPNGYFLVSSDVLHPIMENTIGAEKNRGEWLYPKNMAAIYTKCKFKIFGESNFEIEEFFMRSTPGYEKKPPQHSDKPHLPLYHYFHYKYSNVVLTMARFAFKKII